MLTIPYLEIPITHVCNLHCDGCCYYANYNLKTTASVDGLRDSLAAWSKRIKPRVVKILGGEPLLHRQFPEIFLSVRNLLPDSHVQVITNGQHLARWPVLPYLLTAPNTSLSLSIHSNEPDYLAKLQDSIGVLNGWVEKFAIKVISSDNRVGWKRHHIGVGSFMRPYADGDPATSWRVCPAQVCRVLLEGRLWKCPQIANLHLAADKFSLQSRQEWAPYLAYEGIAATCSDDELRAHVGRGPEPVCGMCPAHPETYEKDIHNVDFDLPDAVRVERGGTVVHRRQRALAEVA